MAATLEERKAASRLASRKYRLAHPDRVRAYQQRYRWEHREQLRAYSREHKKRYYRANRERILQWQRDYTRRNHERLRVYWLAYAKSHREEAKIKTRAWYAANRERTREYRQLAARHRYANDPGRREYLRQWKQRNRDRFRDYLRVSRHRRRSAEGPGFSSRQWRTLLSDYGNRCAYCGALGQLEVDHRIPLSRGGKNSIENVVPACPTCNRRKGTKTWEAFLALLAVRA